MNFARLCLVGLLLAACVSETRDNPLDGKIVAAVPVPEITKVIPQKGAPGTQITLKGKNFGAASADVKLSIGAAATAPAARTATELSFAVPATMPAGVAEITLAVDGEAAEAVTFAVAPVVSSLSRAAGYAGMTLVIEGVAFGEAQGKVRFGSVEADVMAWSPAAVTVTVPNLQTAQTGGPPGGGTPTQPAADVSVVVNGVASDPAAFTMFTAVPGARCPLPCNSFGGVTAMARSGMPDPRQYHTAVWTGSQLVVWGGQLAEPLRTGTACTATGARYAPATDTWTPVNAAGGPAARCKHAAAWLGNRMFVAGGEADTATHAAAAGSYDYDPAADGWTSRGDPGGAFTTDTAAAVTTDTHLFVWGGAACPGRIYDRVAHAWSALPAAPKCLAAPGAAGDGTNLWVWGGTYAGAATNSGYQYDSVGGTWSTLPDAGLSVRTGAAVVYAGGKLIVYGGGKDTNYYADGADYSAGAGWRSMPAGAIAMGLKLYGIAVYGGTKALVIAQSLGTGYTGFLYDPADQSVASWNNGLGTITPQKLVVPVLMGNELAVFGGLPFSMP
jgi:hypothetical protein